MEYLNKDLRAAWERDYSHLMFKSATILGENVFKYNDCDFYLLTGNKSLCVRLNGISETIVFRIEVNELKSNYFLDILNPTENELVLFELEYGFEWPFQEKNKKKNLDTV